MKPLLIASLAVLLAARTSAALADPGLLWDDFDTGNVDGGLPVGWTIAQPAATQLRIAEAQGAPGSAPFCVELSDDSTVSRPEMTRAFAAPASAGSASVRVRIAATAQAPMSMQLLTSSGKLLVAAVISANGVVGYDLGSSRVESAVPWTPGTWLTLRVDWFDDDRFDAYLGPVKFADRVSFAEAGDPGKLMLTAGYGEVTGRRVQVDAVRVGPLRTSTTFATDPVGAPPAGWWISAPAGTDARVVDGQSVPLAAGARALELVDSSPSGRVEAVRSFAATAEGSLSLTVRLPSSGEAPLDVQLHAAGGPFLVALRLGTDGKVSYNAHPQGTGPFTATSVAFAPAQWQTLRIDWSGQDRFSAFLDGVAVASEVPLAAAGDPAKLSVIAGTAASTGARAHVSAVSVAQQPVQSVRGRYQDNAVWLAHCYANAASCIDRLPDLLHRLDVHYQVRTLFLNVGHLTDAGALFDPALGLSKVDELLDAVAAYEAATGQRFQIIAWINGVLADDTGVVIDLAQASTRAAIVDAARRLVSGDTPGSYVAGVPRPFDGVQLDLEPSGLDEIRFGHYMTLLSELRSDWSALGLSSRRLGVAAHALGDGSPWRWPAAFFYQMAPLVDHLAVMTYTTGIGDAPIFRTWIEAQTRAVLEAVSGESGPDSDGDGVGDSPPPSNGVRVFLGLPAMAASPYHQPAVENIKVAAPGIDAALVALLDQGRRAASYFQGTAVYLHHDGTGADGFASWATDWWWFGRRWLGRW